MQLSKARAGLLDLLSAQVGAVSVAEMASLSGQHRNTVREHLEALAAAGLARSRTRPARGRGRPPLLYTAVPVERSRPQVREYARLAAALSAHVASTSQNPAEDARGLGRCIGAELRDEVPGTEGAEPPEGAEPAESPEAAGSRGPAVGTDDAPSLRSADRRTSRAAARRGAGSTTRDAARVIIGILRGLGYDPHRVNGRVVLRQCPVLAVARQHPEIVCHVHLGVVEGVYATTAGSIPDGVALEPFAEPAGCRLDLPGLAEPADPTPG